MTKSQLIEEVAKRANTTVKKAELIVDTIFSSMVEALENNDRIEIRGFGSFVNKSYGAYVGRNPRSGESIEVPPKHLPFFKVGKELREILAKPKQAL
ncbi:MAG: integration host factor subunit beta [Deltaproteobacteria bacterium]|nr:integration host factor subunit beta [Deltaproteobacteria bacterium]